MFTPDFSRRGGGRAGRLQYRNRWGSRPSCNPFEVGRRAEFHDSRRRCTRPYRARGACALSSTSCWPPTPLAHRSSSFAGAPALRSSLNQERPPNPHRAKVVSFSAQCLRITFASKTGKVAAGSANGLNYGRQPSNMIWSVQRPATLRFSSVRTVQVSNGSPNTVRARRGAAAGRSLTE